MKENKNLLSTTNGEVSYQNPSNSLKSSKIEIPAVLVDTVNKIFQESLTHKGNRIPNEEGLWKILIKPEFKSGIKNGELLLEKGVLEIRNSQTGQFVGKAQLSSVNIEDVTKKGTAPSLLKISRSIASISGQLQMAEISKKLDLIHDKINLIGEFLWRDKVSELQAINSTVEEAIESLPNEYALIRINDSIGNLKSLSVFFQKTIEDLLNKKIDYRLSGDFVDGLKFWEWRRENKNEYNKRYNNEIQAFINEYSFLIDLYFQSLGLIGTCYQITNEYHHASKYFNLIDTKINSFSNELSNKLIYLLNVSELQSGDNIDFSNLCIKLKNRKLPKSMLNEIDYNKKKTKEIKDMHSMLTTQFENIQITYEANPTLLLEEIDNDSFKLS